MARFVIRNYGPSRQIEYEGQRICLYHDQCIETDDDDIARALEQEKQIHVTDRGEGMATPVDLSVETDDDKERQVTADDAEALYRENHPEDYEDMTVKELKEIASVLEAVNEIDYEDMTVKELKEIAKDRMLRTTGLKRAGLIQLLQDYDSEDHSEDDFE